MRFLFLILVLFAHTAHAKDYTLILPDSFSCAPDQCNSCEFKMIGFGPFKASMPHSGCTQLACGSSPDIDALFDQCSGDWRYSKNIRYNTLSALENQCVNGVRNHNYWEDTYQRKPFGDLSEDEAALRHSEQSAAYAYDICKGYFESTLKEFGFSEKEHQILAAYIASRQFPHVKGHKVKGSEYAAGWTQTSTIRGEKRKNADVLKTILDVLKTENRINHHMVITPQLYDRFMAEYKDLRK